MSNEAVKIFKFNTFEEFWNRVSPLGDIGKYLKGFIYRGESSNSYNLLPKVLREKKYTDKPSLVYKEIESIIEFCIEANKQGLKVPNYKLLSGRSPEEIIGSCKYYWISNEFEETAALAQHYGLPTRLLDWTKDIFTSFYFASIGVLKKKEIKTNECLTIYALNFAYLDMQIKDWRKHEGSTNYIPIPIKFILPPYFDNANSKAQNGILSYSEIEIVMYNQKSWAIDFEPLDKKLQNLTENKDNFYYFSNSETLLYKFESQQKKQ